MRIQQIDIDKIIFIKKEYSNSMYESIKRIGLSFPIKVIMEMVNIIVKMVIKELVQLRI